LLIGWKRDFDGRVAYLDADGNMGNLGGDCNTSKPIYAVEEGTRKFWIANDTDEFQLSNGNTCEKFKFDSPFSHVCSDISIARGEVYLATPGGDANQSPLYGRTGLYIFGKDGTWRRFNGAPPLNLGDCQFDMWRVAAHPVQDKFFVGSFVGGLLEVSGNNQPPKCYDQFNSILQNAGASGTNRTAISGLSFDRDTNLWICNYNADAPIAVRKPNGILRNFKNAPADILTQVVVDNNGYKWFVVGFNGGVLVYDSGANLDSEADDRYRLLNTTNSVLPTPTVNTLAVDADGDVWVGTRQGVVSFECGSNIFNAELCKGTRQTIVVDDFSGYLLQNEDVRAVAVDGANRKWFGTTNGIFVHSPDGRTLVERYTTGNSPLPDNTINEIAINGENGEVWIATEKGVVSLRGEATQGGRINQTTAYAYPNPVMPGYEGPVAIYGLARDANVKITDASGTLIYEGTALGGQAVWNGRDYLGRRAASGVYFIYATSVENFDSPDTFVTKVVIIN
jgi:Two component regulator propeller